MEENAYFEVDVLQEQYALGDAWDLDFGILVEGRILRNGSGWEGVKGQR